MQITSDLLKRMFPGTDKHLRDRWIPFWNRILPQYGIDDELEVAAFVGTVGVESDYLRTTIEYASGSAYEGRRDLKNFQTGDGKRFKGRGGIQRTGRGNYTELNKLYGNKIGIDFVKNPEKLAEMEHAVHSDCLFWQSHKLNELARRGKYFAIQGIVNRGQAGKMPLHWDKRKKCYEIALAVLPNNFRLENTDIKQADTLPPIDTDTPRTPLVPVMVETIEPDVLEILQTEDFTPHVLNQIEDFTEGKKPDHPQISVEMNAPAKEGSTSTVVTTTILGIAVPGFIGVAFKAVTDLISQGFVSSAEIGSFAMNLIKDNQKYIFWIVLALTGLLAIKKICKQITFWIQMYFKASKDYQNVEVKPQ